MEKKYYTLCLSTDYVEVGEWMQIEEVYKYNNENYNDYQTFRFDSELAELPKRLEFEIGKNAIVTDLLSNSLLGERAGLTMSPKAKALFENFNIGGEHKFFEIKCFHKRKKYDYYFFFLRTIKSEIIYKESLFDINTYLPTELGELTTIKNEEEYDRLLEKWSKGDGIKTIFPRKLILKKEIDICRLPNTPDIIVSEAVKLACEKMELSGLEFEPATCKIIIQK